MSGRSPLWPDNGPFGALGNGKWVLYYVDLKKIVDTSRKPIDIDEKRVIYMLAATTAFLAEKENSIPQG